MAKSAIEDILAELDQITARLFDAVRDVDRSTSASAVLVDLARFRLDQIAHVVKSSTRLGFVSGLAEDLHARLSYAHRYPEMVLYTLYLDTTEVRPVHSGPKAIDLPISAYEVASLHSLGALISEQRGHEVGKWISYRLSVDDASLIARVASTGVFEERELRWLAKDVDSCRRILVDSGVLGDLSEAELENALALVLGWECSIGELIAAAELL